jgi:hypothetical protein
VGCLNEKRHGETTAFKQVEDFSNVLYVIVFELSKSCAKTALKSGENKRGVTQTGTACLLKHGAVRVYEHVRPSSLLNSQAARSENSVWINESDPCACTAPKPNDG